MTDHDIAVARDQIRALLARYNNCADRGRIAEFLDVFAPDGVLETRAGRLEGRDAIAASLNAIVAGAVPEADLAGSRHHLTTSRIEIASPAEAEGWSYFFVSRRGVILQEGLYMDRFRHLAEGWRIAHRRIKMLYVAGLDD